jgi:hypothetical protein
MNTKEKILFIASQEYVTKLNEQNLDFENRIFPLIEELICILSSF